VKTELSRAEARRIALAAQGFADAAPRGTVDRRAIARVLSRIGLLQIDSVNVLVRSHYLPLFSRLASYDPALLDREAYGAKRSLFEYWAHMASLVPLVLEPQLRWRMARARRALGTWPNIARIVVERPQFLEQLKAQIAERGPMAAGEFEGTRGSGSWWGWSDVKIGLEALFWGGEITTLRRKGFERIYDLTERVLPRAILDVPTPSEADAQRELMRVAARALGVASEKDLRDYFRLSPADSRARIAELVESGELRPVEIEGLRGPHYLVRDARLPRSVSASALLSPFDSLIWHRARTSELFDFEFRLEIYTPSHKRVHGYYVLPFLLGDRLVARVDLKHDRAEGTLRAHAIHVEKGIARPTVMPALRDRLEAMAHWLGAEKVSLPGR
jgi:hypothetical protein